MLLRAYLPHVMPKDAFPIPANSCGDEKLPLLADHDGSYRARASPAHARRFTISFFLMAACFSVNHGTVTGCDQLPSPTPSLPPSFLNPTPPLTAFNCPLSSPFIHKNRNVKPETCFQHRSFSALLSLASVNLGPDLGGDSSGSLYAAYTVSAATIAASGGIRPLPAAFSMAFIQNGRLSRATHG
jgi:hypothetical protein